MCRPSGERERNRKRESDDERRDLLIRPSPVEFASEKDQKDPSSNTMTTNQNKFGFLTKQSGRSIVTCSTTLVSEIKKKKS